MTQEANLQQGRDRKRETEKRGGTKMEGRIEKHTMSSGQDIKRETNTLLQDFKESADNVEYTHAHTLPSCCVVCDSN